MAQAEWHEASIRIRDRSWPIVQMEWIEGRTLDRYVDHLVEEGDRTGLSALATAWRDLVITMQADHFAHGDLQHGNVLVDQHGRLRLVDLDAVWIPGLVGLPAPDESGHPNYQRQDAPWNEHRDTFPGLVVYLALRMLAHNPQPWAVLHNEDNLLFTREDFEDPALGPAWKHLSALHDPSLDRLGDQLRAACDPLWRAVDDFASIIGRAGDVVGGPDSRPWWVQTADRRGEVPAGTTSTGPLRPPPPKETTQQPTASPAGARSASDRRAGSEWWGWQPETEIDVPPPDGRQWKSLCLAAVMGVAAGFIVAVVASHGGGNGGEGFAIAFFSVGLITYLVSLAVFATRPPPGMP
ncbi:hypothetical protein [Actinomycetospora sp. NBRC 106378]|uniref:hypothetical protein n=1 Tax=Actinomycetospora sp. NBRC 106378 TaxID=3032208 RepID=UPI002552B6EF|nr:hypothetical protein [Actinomycetospora sp. NBRC 106378]